MDISKIFGGACDDRRGHLTLTLGAYVHSVRVFLSVVLIFLLGCALEITLGL